MLKGLRLGMEGALLALYRQLLVFFLPTQEFCFALLVARRLIVLSDCFLIVFFENIN